MLSGRLLDDRQSSRMLAVRAAQRRDHIVPRAARTDTLDCTGQDGGPGTVGHPDRGLRRGDRLVVADVRSTCMMIPPHARGRWRVEVDER